MILGCSSRQVGKHNYNKNSPKEKMLTTQLARLCLTKINQTNLTNNPLLLFHYWRIQDNNRTHHHNLHRNQHLGIIPSRQLLIGKVLDFQTARKCSLECSSSNRSNNCHLGIIQKEYTQIIHSLSQFLWIISKANSKQHRYPPKMNNWDKRTIQLLPLPTTTTTTTLAVSLVITVMN